MTQSPQVPGNSEMVALLRKWAECLDIESGRFVNEDLSRAADALSTTEARIEALEAERGEAAASSEYNAEIADFHDANATKWFRSFSAAVRRAEAAEATIASLRGGA
jgi:hypothetical protein